MPKNAGGEWEAIVSAFYHRLLLRPPDQSGLSAHSRLLQDGERTVEDVLASILESEEFRMNFDRFGQRYAEPDSSRFTKDSSQFGEIDLLLKRIVNDGCRHRIVVDVGVLGREGSNSYDLMRYFGWWGLLVEANPTLADSIRDQFHGLKMELVSAAVSDYVGEALFYLGSNDAISSLNAAAAEGWGAVRDKVMVPVTRLRDILDSRDIPHDFELLSIDVEGEDIKVLNDTIDHSPYRPRWVIIEASYDFKTQSLSDLPFSQAVVEQYEITDRTRANLLLRFRDRVATEPPPTP